MKIALHAKVAYMHFKDFIRMDENYEGRAYQAFVRRPVAGRIAGEGSIDLSSLITRLRQAGYDGWLTVEYEGDDGQNPAQPVRSQTWNFIYYNIQMQKRGRPRPLQRVEKS